MYMYVPSKTSNAGIDLARPDKNSSFASGLVCLAMTSSRKIHVWPKPKVCGTKSLIRERLAEETALRTCHFFILKKSSQHLAVQGTSQFHQQNRSTSADASRFWTLYFPNISHKIIKLGPRQSCKIMIILWHKWGLAVKIQTNRSISFCILSETVEEMVHAFNTERRWFSNSIRHVLI